MSWRTPATPGASLSRSSEALTAPAPRSSGHTGHQRLDSPIAPAKVLDPRGLLVHHVPHGVGLDEDQSFDLDVAHLKVRWDEGSVQLAEALEPRVVESMGVPEVDVAVHH